MPRYIDADALIVYLQYNLGLLGKPDVEKEPIAHGCYIVLEDMLVRILTTHTADVVEVRHGHWIDRDDKTWCSLCDASNKQYKPPYCPHCGAKMDEKEKSDIVKYDKAEIYANQASINTLKGLKFAKMDGRVTE